MKKLNILLFFLFSVNAFATIPYERSEVKNKVETSKLKNTKAKKNRSRRAQKIRDTKKYFQYSNKDYKKLAHFLAAAGVVSFGAGSVVSVSNGDKMLINDPTAILSLAGIINILVARSLYKTESSSIDVGYSIILFSELKRISLVVKAIDDIPKNITFLKFAREIKCDECENDLELGKKLSKLILNLNATVVKLKDDKDIKLKISEKVFHQGHLIDLLRNDIKDSGLDISSNYDLAKTILALSVVYNLNLDKEPVSFVD